MRFVLVSACVLPCLAHAAAFQSFDVRGGGGTCGDAIASNGLVAGETFTPQTVGVITKDTSQPARPFLYASGLAWFPPTGSLSGTVTFTGVTKDRFIAGNAISISLSGPSTTTPFVLHHGAVSTPSVGTLPVSGLFGITDRGAILGEATSVKQLGGGFSATYTFAFLRAPDGAVTTIDDGSGFMTPRGMDARADKVVGWSFVSGATGWLFSGGAFTPVNYPGSSLTVPAGVDEAGTISGTYYVGDLSMPDSVVTHGFFLRHGAYTSFDFPRAKSTVVQAMNEADQVTGCYTDARGTHGFVRTP